MLSGCGGAATALLDLVAVRGTIQLVWRNCEGMCISVFVYAPINLGDLGILL